MWNTQGVGEANNPDCEKNIDFVLLINTMNKHLYWVNHRELKWDRKDFENFSLLRELQISP